MDSILAQGKAALKVLAKRFPQLYVAPAEEAQEAHRLASGRGQAPEGANLGHFASTPDDELRLVDTPAGPVEVLFLKDRGAFETFLQVVGHKSSPVPIARTVGAITYRGLADWGKVAKAYADFQDAGGGDWGAEFARLAKEPAAFRSEIVVISEGPYSNIAARQTPYAEDEWPRVSREIRLHHECAHVVCRRLMPEDIAPVWDEVTADVVGLLCATGRYDAALATLFLGTMGTGYAGGRLEEYLDDTQKAHIDAVAAEVHAAIERIQDMCTPEYADNPFDFLLDLKHDPLLAY